MLEVVFGSVKGAMKAAQHCGQNVCAELVTVNVLSSDDETLSPEEKKKEIEKAKQKFIERQRELERNAIPIGGNPKDVYGLAFALSIGDIAAPIDSDLRRDSINRWLTTGAWDDPEEVQASAERYWQECLIDLENLKRRACAGESVRIWYDHSPDGMCGLCFAVSELKEAKGVLSKICLPTYEEEKNAIICSTSWNEVVPEKLGSYLPLEKALTPAMQNALRMQWRRLQTENAPLRVVVNGRLRSVPADFYDYFITKEIPDGDFAVGKLIGDVIGRNQLGISDWLISQRISTFIEEGKLVVVKKGDYFYGTVLCANSSL